MCLNFFLSIRLIAPNPYVTFNHGGDGTKQCQTSTLVNSQKPKWNEVFHIRVHDLLVSNIHRHSPSQQALTFVFYVFHQPRRESTTDASELTLESFLSIYHAWFLLLLYRLCCTFSCSIFLCHSNILYFNVAVCLAELSWPTSQFLYSSSIKAKSFPMYRPMLILWSLPLYDLLPEGYFEGHASNSCMMIGLCSFRYRLSYREWFIAQVASNVNWSGCG